jgi:hypothetical protein
MISTRRQEVCFRNQLGPLVYVAILAAALVSIGVVLGREERNPTKAGLSCVWTATLTAALNEILALWLAPIVSTLPLIPFFSLRFSPLFLGTLMADRGPTTSRWIGPVLSAAGVIFDGTILGYAALFVVALPVYLILRRLNQLSPVHIVLLGAIAGIIASQFVAYVRAVQTARTYGICPIVVVPLAGWIVGRRCGMVRRSSVWLSEAGPNELCFSRIPVADRRRDSVCFGDDLVGSGLESSINQGTAWDSLRILRNQRNCQFLPRS